MAEQFVSVNPATGKQLAAYKIDDDKKVESALKLAVKAFEEWRKLSFKQRALVLRSIAKEIRKEGRKSSRV